MRVSFDRCFKLIGFLINMQVQGHHPHQLAPLPGNWLAARIAYLTPDLQVLLSWGPTVLSFHPRQPFYVSFFHVSLSLPGSLYIACCSDCTTRTPHMSKRAKPSLSQNEVKVLELMLCKYLVFWFDISNLSDHDSAIALQALQARLGQCPGFHWHVAWSPVHIPDGHGPREKWVLAVVPWIPSRRFSHEQWPLVHRFRRREACHPGGRRNLPPQGPKFTSLCGLSSKEWTVPLHHAHL